MTQKNCLVYETLGKVSDLKVMEAKGDGLMRLEGVFGVCGVKNQNNRVYDKENYRQMVESLQQTIKETGCPGELEHPNSMNITLENVSHKIESIQMNEDGTITGTIALLNTPKGQIAKAIVEGGLPLFISSRGAGTITNEGRVTLSTIKTYDLVGTPGFSQAKLTLKENQTLECLNESLDDGNVMYAIVEGDDLLGGDDDSSEKSDDEDKDKKESDEKEKKEDDSKEEEKDKKEDDSKEEEKDKKDKEDNKNNKEKVNMNELKEAIDKLTDKVSSLEAELHVAQESLNETKSSIVPVNYDAIEKWVMNEFSSDFKAKLLESMDNSDIEQIVDDKVNEAIETLSTNIQNWVVEEFAPEVQNWIVEEFAPEVQNWVCEEFAPEVQNWVVEEFAPEVQNWITEEYSPEVQNWITEEFAPVIDNWINEEFAPEHTKTITDKVNENVSAFMEAQNAGRLEQIDNLLESISDDKNSDVNKIVDEANKDNKFKGVYVVENMPSEYKPQWEMLSEERKNEIVRSSRMYDFTKEGVLESFWTNQDFDKKDAVTLNESKVVTPTMNYQQSIISQMKHLRNTNF